ncbi:polysaccharide biosynthesis/export family protein [Crenothrix sp.]|uniref:polysaccharide biosynthesis/export family protein n=1 Tax=Crenothrix sp. TaxID=3100433 RepID=UPI00374D07D4
MRICVILWLIVLSQLTACTVIPGMHMSPFSVQSHVEVPITENNKTTLKKLNIKLITAQLILDLEKDFNNRSLGKDNVANHYFDYRIGSKTVKETPMQEPYYQYMVGPRDILTITVWEHPELTIPAGEFRSAEASGTLVGEDGSFYYPYAGIIKAAGRAVEDIRNELVRKLSAFIEMVQLDVRVAGYRSQRVYVVGEVKQPGIQTVKDIPLTVLEAINNAGGVNPEADLRNLTLTRQDKSYSINLLALYEGGDLRQNVLLQHGDVINVPDSMFNKIFVLGDTTVGGAGAGRGRSVMMNKGRMTLAEVLSDAGGLNQDTSDPSRIFVFRSGINKPEIFHLDAKSPDALLLADRFPMQPRDVVYVDRAEGIRWNQIIAQIQPTVSLLSSFGTIQMKPFEDTSTSGTIPCVPGFTCP